MKLRSAKDGLMKFFPDVYGLPFHVLTSDLEALDDRLLTVGSTPKDTSKSVDQLESAHSAAELLQGELKAFGKAPEVIHVGDTVEWENKDIFVHSATADDKSFDVDMQPNRTARVVMRRAGTIHYICKYHPGMTSGLVVTPAR